MEEDRNQEPRERFRSILSNQDEETDAQFQPEPEPEPQSQSQPLRRSPLDQLPHLRPTSQTPPQVEPVGASPKPEAPASSASLGKLPKSKKPGQTAQIPTQQTVTQTQAIKPGATPNMRRSEKYLRALWTIASMFSMILNVVVIIFLVIAYWAYRDIKVPESLDMTMVNKLLSGLYTNFEKMDRASIDTVIPVDAQVPLNINVPVQTTTQVTLADSVSIPNAQVVINTGGLNINSTARITLPAGTPLTVNLNFDLPVQASIPIHLEVPVHIPMAETQLHEPFVGLQEVVEPIYCFVEPSALNLDGQVICQ
jgi:hypothetical protein